MLNEPSCHVHSKPVYRPMWLHTYILVYTYDVCIGMEATSKHLIEGLAQTLHTEGGTERH